MHVPFLTFLRIMRIALGYGSRTERIQRMLHSPHADVAVLAHSLVTRGLLDRDAGSLKAPIEDANWRRTLD